MTRGTDRARTVSLAMHDGPVTAEQPTDVRVFDHLLSAGLSDESRPGGVATAVRVSVVL
jgi:hypothetical protein